MLRAHERDIASRTAHGERCAQMLAVSDNRDERAWTGEGGPQLGEDLKLPAVPGTGVIVTRSRSQGAVPSSRLLVRKAVRRLRQARQLSGRV